MKLPEIEISIKYKGTKKSELKSIKSSADIYAILTELHNADTVDWIETMILICMNRQNKIIGYYKVSSGGTTATICDPKVIFTVALNCAGTQAIILSHNHPSGNLTPSASDKELTQKIKLGAALLDMVLIDHVIYTDNGYYSFADDGNL